MSAPGGDRPLVLVTVGTDYHRFDRLVTWVEDWIEESGADVRCVVQCGRSSPPRRAEGRPYLEHAELQELMSAAAVVVSHGGPGTLTEARSHGHLPICVPRDPERGEHVDGHQQRFARHLAGAGLVTLAETPEALGAALGFALATFRRRGGRHGADRHSTSAGPSAALRQLAVLLRPLTAHLPADSPARPA